MKSSKLAPIIIIVLLTLSAIAQAHPQVGGIPAKAREVDEYEMNRASMGDMKARLDGFFEELQKEPGSQAYIFIYGGMRARPRYRAIAIRDYLELRGLPAARLKIVQGGSRDEPMLEFWVVPEGAQPPQATPPYRASRNRKR
jgi:hypothetical protein